MHDFTELDRSLNLNKSENYHLSIQLAPDGFSFCLLETYLSRYVGVKHYNFKSALFFDDYLEAINKILTSDSVLKNSFASVSLLNISPKAILIPSEIFKAEDVKQYFNLNEELGEFDEIHYNYIPSFELYNVFSVHHELLNVFRHKFPEIGVYQQWSSLIEKPEIKEASGECVYVNFNSEIFDLVVVREGKLILCNSFPYKNESDFVFYLLNALKKLNVDPSKSELSIIGDTHNKGKYFELLNKFVDNFEIGNTGDSFSFSVNLKNISKPYFYNLYNLYNCVLSAENSEG